MTNVKTIAVNDYKLNPLRHFTVENASRGFFIL